MCSRRQYQVPFSRLGPYDKTLLDELVCDRMVARVDLKADRSGRRLVVLAAHIEPAVEAGPAAEALARELRTMAGWLGLESVRIERRGEFARPLAAAVRASK